MLDSYHWENLFYDPILFDANAGDSVYSKLYEVYLQECDGAKVLDLGAGTGNFSKILIDKGKSVSVVDSSHQMIERLMAKYDSLFNDVFCGTLKDFSTDTRFDNIVAIDDFTTHFLGADALRNEFTHIRSLLKSDGKFITDLRARSEERMGYSLAELPKSVKTWGIVPNIEFDSKIMDVCIKYWEQYFSEEQVLATYFQYDYINNHGSVVRTNYRVIKQKLHTPEGLMEAAEGLFKLERSKTISSSKSITSKIFIFQPV